MSTTIKKRPLSWLIHNFLISHEDAMNERLSYKGIYGEESTSYHIEEKALVDGIYTTYDDNQKRLEVCYYTKDKLVERFVELSAECEKLEKMLRSK